jgi:hypothetical protein
MGGESLNYRRSDAENGNAGIAVAVAERRVRE